jgi:hypothetical protein
LGQTNTNPAARHERLAAAIAEELKSGSYSRTNHQAYVHWLHLDPDDIVDALVIVKPNESSCAVIKGCLGLIMRGDSEGFRTVSVFMPNQHPIFLGPRFPDGSLRSLYISQDGRDFVEMAYREGHYQVGRRGLSYKSTQSLAPWTITERQFDELMKQTAFTRRASLQPAGAPIELRVEAPPTSIVKPFKRLSYETTRELESEFRAFLSQIASRLVLSHTVLVELVACEDWIARVPLKDRGDRPLNNVVVCQELLGLLHEKFPNTLSNDLGGLIPPASRENPTKEDVDRAMLELIEKHMKPTGVLPSSAISRENKLQAILYILAGSLGQSLALQQNIPERVLARINASYVEGDKIIDIATAYTLTSSQFLYYLVGYRASTEGAHSFLSQNAPDDLVNRATSFIKYKKSLLITNKEQDLFLEDIPTRSWAFHCALRAHENKRSLSTQTSSGHYIFPDHSDPDWKTCDYLLQILTALSKE